MSGATRAACSGLAAGTVRRLLARGTRVRLTVRGISMSPALCHGERVVVGPLEGRPKPGDLLVVGSGDQLLIRRLVERPSEGVVFTTGCESRRHGTPLAESALIGVINVPERDGPAVEQESPGGVLRRLSGVTRLLMGRKTE